MQFSAPSAMAFDEIVIEQNNTTPAVKGKEHDIPGAATHLVREIFLVP